MALAVMVSVIAWLLVRDAAFGCNFQGGRLPLFFVFFPGASA